MVRSCGTTTPATVCGRTVCPVPLSTRISCLKVLVASWRWASMWIERCSRASPCVHASLGDDSLRRRAVGNVVHGEAHAVLELHEDRVGGPRFLSHRLSDVDVNDAGDEHLLPLGPQSTLAVEEICGVEAIAPRRHFAQILADRRPQRSFGQVLIVRGQVCRCGRRGASPARGRRLG